MPEPECSISSTPALFMMTIAISASSPRTASLLIWISRAENTFALNISDALSGLILKDAVDVQGQIQPLLIGDLGLELL